MSTRPELKVGQTWWRGADCSKCTITEIGKDDVEYVNLGKHSVVTRDVWNTWQFGAALFSESVPSSAIELKTPAGWTRENVSELWVCTAMKNGKSCRDRAVIAKIDRRDGDARCEACVTKMLASEPVPSPYVPDTANPQVGDRLAYYGNQAREVLSVKAGEPTLLRCWNGDGQVIGDNFHMAEDPRNYTPWPSDRPWPGDAAVSSKVDPLVGKSWRALNQFKATITSVCTDGVHVAFCDGSRANYDREYVELQLRVNPWVEPAPAPADYTSTHRPSPYFLKGELACEDCGRHPVAMASMACPVPGTGQTRLDHEATSAELTVAHDAERPRPQQLPQDPFESLHTGLGGLSSSPLICGSFNRGWLWASQRRFSR